MKIHNLLFPTLIIIVASSIIPINVVNAQLKLYPIGSLSIGSITQPPNHAELQVIGNAVFSKNTGAIISSAYIKGLNNYSTDSIPDFSWWGDTLTGIFHPISYTMAFSCNGKETMRLSQGNNLLIGSTSDIGDKVQVTAALNQNPFDIYANYTTAGYSGMNWVNNTTTKAWAVEYNSQDEFYVYGNGQAYSYGWNTISDSTLKENVLEIPNALNKVLRLQGVTYNLKQTELADAKGLSGSSSRKMGLIAQQVERVAPEAVTTNNDGIKTVAYGNMVGLLIEALKQEDAKVNMLQHRLDSCIVSNRLKNN